MAEQPLRGLRILVAEDEYLLAQDLAHWLAAAGATVLGPVTTVEDAIRLLGAERRIDGAVLDINLRGERAFEVADVLESLSIPFIFATGYEHASLPRRYAHVSRCDKPLTPETLTRTLGNVLSDRGP